jgi:DNA-binding NarL/FixJ family response regulator
MSLALAVDRTVVTVVADDPLSRVGLSSQLRGELDISLTEDVSGADVVLAVVETIDETSCAMLRRLSAGGRRVVLVAGEVDGSDLYTVVEAGVCGVVPRSDATASRLIGAVRAAARGDGSLPPALLGRLLAQVTHVQRRVLMPRGLTPTGLTEREVRVLRMLADGHETSTIARELNYSERTVKNIVHDITTRLQLRNRAHAVAFGIRNGLI